MLIYFICQTLQVLLTTFRLFNLQAEKRLVSMTRRDLSHNILEVAHTGGEERWLVVKRMLYPKKASVVHIFLLIYGEMH